MPTSFRVGIARCCTAVLLAAILACGADDAATGAKIAGIPRPRAALAEGAMVTGSATSTLRVYNTNGTVGLSDADDGWLFSYPVVNGIAERPVDPAPLYGDLDSAQVTDTFPHYQPSGAHLVGLSFASALVIAQDMESSVTAPAGDVIRTTVSKKAPAGTQAVPCQEDGSCPVAVIRQYRNGIISSEAVLTWTVAPDGSGYLLLRNKYTVYDSTGTPTMQMDVPVQQAQSALASPRRRSLPRRALLALGVPLRAVQRAAVAALTPEDLYAQITNCNGICMEADRASREAGRAAKEALRDPSPTKKKYAKESAKYAIKVSIECSICMILHGCG